MAFGLKYELLCTSKINSNANKLKLLFDGYTGVDDDPIDRNMPGDSPLVLRKDKAAVIRGTSLDFGIREAVDFELDEFYTNNPKKIKAELYEDTTLLWTGYNLPQQYQAAYIPAPGTIRFTATDGLGMLKNEKYNQTGTNSQLATIIYCVDKIELALGYSIAINLFETTHDHALSPLAQTYVDSSVFNGLNCYAVIERILELYDAEITQVNARWHITRSVDKKSTRMLYSTSGVYETTAVATAVLDLGYPDTAGVEVWPVDRLSRSLEPGANKVTITHDFGRKASLLDNYEFWRYAGGEFTGWSKLGAFDTLQRIKDGKAYALLSGYSADPTMQIYQTIPVTNVVGEDFVFELNFSPIAKIIGPANQALLKVPVTVRMYVILFDGATYYWLSKTEGWLTTPTMIEAVVWASLGAPVWNTIKVITSGLPASGNMTVGMYRFQVSGLDPDVLFTGIALSEPSVYFSNDGEPFPSGLKTLAVFDNSTEPGDLGTIALLAADAPAVANKGLLYKNITRLLDGTPTAGWHVLGDATEYSQVVQLARTLASNNRIARQKLTGTIKGTGISFNSIIKHAYNGNREFEISEVQWDLYNETYQVTLLELLAWSSETITFTTESENTNSATPTSGGAIIGVGLGNDTGGSLTPEDLLAKLLEVDGAGSSLDADKLDGNEAAYFLPAASYTAADVLAKLLTVDGVASGLNSDLLDDAEGALYARLADPIFTGTVHAPILHSTTILTDHIGEHTGAHSIVFDNPIKGESLESITAFSAGFAGDGYKVIETGGVSNLEVDSLTVRGTLKAYELQIDKISSVNGGMVISVANAKCTTVSGTTIYFDEGIGLTIPFVVDDYIKAQQFNGTGVAAYLGKVTAVNAGNVVATTISGTPWNGMNLVQFGNSATAARQNLLYLTAADTNNPFIEGHSGITAGVFTDATRKFRLGNLTGITDATLSPSGYGLYAQNVFLSGKIIATSGSFSGMASFGTDAIAGDNLIIEGSDISNRTHDSDDATIYINYRGYDGLYTRFRNFIVGSGKAGDDLLIYAQGTPKRIGIATDAVPDSTFQVGTTNGAGLKINYNGAGVNYLYGLLTSDSGIVTTGGIHVGGTSDPGADNLLIEGDVTTIGLLTGGSLQINGPSIFSSEMSLPLISTVDRDNIIPSQGMMIWNFTSNRPNVYDGANWCYITITAGA